MYELYILIICVIIIVIENFEDFMPPMELTPDQARLEDLRYKAAEALVVRGKIAEESDRLSPDGNVARSFSYPLSPDLVREVFQIDDQETTTPEGCEIVYIPESMLDGQKCQDEIYMRVTTEVKRDSDSVGILRQWVIAGDEGEPIRGERSVEYSIGEKRVSPHNLEPNALIIMDTEDIGGLLDDMYEYTEPMDVDDLDKFEQVVAAIRNSPAVPPQTDRGHSSLL